MKSKNLFLLVLVMILMTVVTPSAQQGLTDSDIADAIRLGQREKGKLTGLSLTDVGRGWVNALILAGNRYADTAGTGFSLRVYTPLTWIQQQASNAAKEYRPFALSDVTQEMLEPVLRVIVYPDKPTKLTAGGMSMSSSVQHIVARDADKRMVLQPLSKEPFTDVASSALRDMAYQGIITKFPLEGIADLRGPSANREFLLVIIGEGTQEKVFTVKEKHFISLGGINKFSRGSAVAAARPAALPAATAATGRTLEPIEFLGGHAMVRFDANEWRKSPSDDPNSVRLTHTSGEAFFGITVGNAQTSHPEERIVKQEPRTINGISFAYAESEVNVGGVIYTYYSFKYSGGIGAFRLTGFATAAVAGKYRDAIERVVSGFDFTGR